MDPITVAATAANVLQGIGSIGGLFGGGDSSLKNTERTLRLNRENQFSIARQMPSIQVAAFKKAGIHPLVGFGQPAYNPGMISVGGDKPSVGERMSDMGQGLGRAAQALQSFKDREKTTLMEGLQIERMKLENDLLRAQTTQVHRATNPAFPSSSDTGIIAGQGDTRGFDNRVSDDVSLSRATSGRNAVIPSESVKQNIEDMMIPELQWYFRQLFGKSPEGKFFNPVTSELHPQDEKSLLGFLYRASIFNRSGKAPLYWLKKKGGQ